MVIPPLGVILFVVIVTFQWFGPAVSRKAGISRPFSSGRPDWDAWAVTVAVARLGGVLVLASRIRGGTWGDPFLPINILGALILAAPEILIVRPLVWLRAPQLVYLSVVLLAPLSAVHDPRAVGVWTALRAASTDAHLAWARGLLQRRSGPAGAWTLLAVARIAERSGDRLRAASLFRQVAGLPPTAGRGTPIALARSWLAAEASARGDAVVLSAAARVPNSEWALHAVYARCRTSRLGTTGQPAWNVVVGSGLRNGALWRAVRWRQQSGAGEGLPQPPPPTADPLGTALSLLSFLSTKPDWALTCLDIEHLARVWAAAPTDALTGRIGRRAAVLEVRTDPDVVRRRLLDAVKPEIVAIVRRLREPMAGPLPPGPVEEARYAVARERSDVVEALARRVVQPVDRDDLEPGWEEWDAFEQGWEHLAYVANHRERAWVLGDIWGPLCNRAASIVNQHRQLLLGHLIFRWLDDHCTACGVGDLKLLRGNRLLTA